ncbi:hemoglobin/transferrin/lactoferrin receptor protein [Nicoletella semolina]|uniref:Hemoglobin/transferrin/lactoferrin receptor protein n=1 Tax=Nicoletella semolina TaxID=271160 RepID=A0A4R2N9B4_9PAST|nr:TonB-dependent hemoglobin/transferrin/lactoferrin family receptor [Nicoletella semolina]MDH2925526.1 hypothetical protein [Nicoletella semolina]TCP17601.1 hemoglobin/transferrin/lactoferrin receptor protein [Nicoletella semolina]
MKLSKLYTAIFLALPTATFSVSIFASSNVAKLEEINVVAFRDATQLAKLANSADKLNKTQLQTLQAGSVADSLKHLNNIDVGQGSLSLAQKPIIRGLSGNRVVQVIDGVRQNFNLAHRGSYFIPASLVQEIEVIKGPATTLWGSGALGGVVAMRTANAFDYLQDNERFAAAVRQGYQSANNLSESTLSLLGATDSLDWLVSGYYNDADNIRVGKGDKIHYSAFNQYGGLAKFGWQINDTNRVELSHRLGFSKQTANVNNEEVFNPNKINSSHSRTATPHSKGNASPHHTGGGSPHHSAGAGHSATAGNDNPLTDQRIVENNSIINYYLTPNNRYINAQITLFKNATKESEKRIKNQTSDLTQLNTVGINLKNSTEFDTVSFTYGIDYHNDEAIAKRGKTTEEARANGYTASSTVIGAYLLSHIKLGEKLTLSPSIRYDSYSAQSQQKYTDSRWSPSASLVWNANSWLDLTARYNEAYRAPSVEERFTSGTHFRAGSIVNTFRHNPDLKPETAKNKELAAHLHFDNLLTQDDNASFKTTLFQNDVEDFINLDVFKSDPNDPRIYTSDVSQFKNVQNARLRGIEVESRYQTSRFGLTFSYAQTRGKDRSKQTHLANIAADKFNVSLNYAIVPEKFTVGTQVSYYATQDRVPQTENARHSTPVMAYPSYTLVGINANYAPLKGEWKNLRLDFAIENLFDKEYQPAFSMMKGKGRNVKLSAGYTF